jgi:nucleoside-diphosphate-sugar epimerase
MKKILITGGLGFSGSVLTEHLLKKNFHVTVIDKILFDNKQIKKFSSFKNFVFYRYDILNKKVENIFKTNNFDFVLHLAAIVGDPACKVNKNLTNKVNLFGSKKIFNLSKKYKVKNFIFFSTCSNYGLSKGNKLLSEKDKLKPLSLYAETKVKFEKLLLNDKAKIKKIILRISTLYGISHRMRFDLTINEFVKKVFFNEKFEIYHADTWRPYLNLIDLKSIIFKILKTKKLSKNKVIFNVGFSNENFTKKQIIKNISKHLPKNKNFKFVDKDFFDKRNYRVNFSKIKLIGMRKQVNLNSGIKELINYLKKTKINSNNNIFYNHK